MNEQQQTVEKEMESVKQQIIHTLKEDYDYALDNYYERYGANLYDIDIFTDNMRETEDEEGLNQEAINWATQILIDRGIDGADIHTINLITQE